MHLIEVKVRFRRFILCKCAGSPAHSLLAFRRERLIREIKLCRLARAFAVRIYGTHEPAHETLVLIVLSSDIGALLSDECSRERVQMCRLARAFAAVINCTSALINDKPVQMCKHTKALKLHILAQMAI